MPDLKFAELIDGIVYMASPVSRVHGDYHFRMSSWLATYVMATPGCQAVSGTTWLMSPESVPQPDLALCILPECGGQSHVEGAYFAGAPELAIEVSYTTAARDTGVKLRLYEQSGVREYLIVRPRKQQVSWRRLVEGHYHEIHPDADGLLRSTVFHGLWLDSAAVWSGDLKALSKPVEQGAADDRHADFVQQLERARR